MSKPKLAYYLAGGCGGCDIAVVDLSETLVDVALQLDIVFWAPTVADAKYKDLEAMPDGSIDVGLVSGNVRNSEHEHIVKVMRQKCKVLIAFGICASCGGIKGLVNLHTTEQLLDKAYINTFSTDNPEKILPQTTVVVDGKYELTLPSLMDARPLDQVVKVDYYVGGCPPYHEHIGKAFMALLSGQLPPSGSWITMGKAVCEVCNRNPVLQGKSKKFATTVKRTIDGPPSEDGCLLEEGYLCLGPVTQGDCGSKCPSANVPCRGCGGPIPGVKDFGLRAISAIASMLDNEELVDQIPDPVHLFYRYTLPSSFLGKKIKR
ncbi:MAG: F420-nonreducing hydrogenase [Thermodesulfovibrio sp.]|uniref:NADH-quinone oxidoreductase subunit B family protein n=1 Tax=unclassified Thermodesulfovibrio TaxID=2645936 RepID=UPI00083A9D2A|nr:MULTISPECIES: F420-nonreducing hydrogenase [unclassified Thermodesulfovibrio]MDI1471216.1 F420-nonreducing hydrogenase [Thermodesulfovibrio sp. 1176]MDI6715300.1 F420-nonreducing hydrogenase [Thermodesulfovibrio sp.]ODA44160.1 methyl-viologen-reducing hydrogenase subunit gamma [Thermodesulfovibrio sp. N1]